MINTFLAFFTRQINIIDALGCVPNQMAGITGREDAYLFKKIAYVCLLDYFASLRFHPSACGQPPKKNNERFKRSLEECTGWDVGSLVSLAFLEERLQKMAPDGRLHKYVYERLKAFGSDFGGTISAKEIDEEPETLLKLASEEKEERAIGSCRHYSIMYRYRNNLVHQARRPGQACEILGEDTSEACYFTYINDSSLHLLYPMSLFKRLCNSSLHNLVGYLTLNNLNPYQLEDDDIYF